LICVSSQTSVTLLDSRYVLDSLDTTLKKHFEHTIVMSDKNQEFQRNVSEQGGVEGQRKEVNVEDYPKAAALGQLLKDVDFPADKQKIIQHVQQKSGNDDSGHDILSKLHNIEDKQYQNVAEVSKAAGMVY
jgi:hypothetical protein